MPFDAAALPDDVDALKAIITDMARDAVAAKSELEKLSAQLARLKRAQFGRSLEKLSAHIEQLELALEALESDEAERLAAMPAMAELATCPPAFAQSSAARGDRAGRRLILSGLRR